MYVAPQTTPSVGWRGRERTGVILRDLQSQQPVSSSFFLSASSSPSAGSSASPLVIYYGNRRAARTRSASKEELSLISYGGYIRRRGPDGARENYDRTRGG